MNKFLGFLCLVIVSMPCYAAIQYIPAPASSTVGMYDPRDPNSHGPFKVIPATQAAAPNVAQPATSTSYIIQLMRWGAPPNPYRVPMVNAQAYYRDAFTGVDFVAQAAADNDQWFVRAIYPTTDGSSSTTQLDGPPLTYYANIGGYLDCFYSPGWLYYICGSPIIYIEFDNQTQCESAGTNWVYQLLYNNNVVDQRTFTMNLQVPPGDVPFALDQNVARYTSVTAYYDHICKDISKSPPETVPCPDPYNIPPNEPWQPYTLAAKACAMTCTAMVANFHGASITGTGLVAMNAYLTSNGGYDREGNVKWANVVAYGTLEGAQWSWLVKKGAGLNQDLRNNICTYGPQIMGVNTKINATGPDHFVVAYGKVSPTYSSWMILDPDGGRDTNSSNYNDINWGERLYKGAAATYPFPIYGFEIKVYSPVELVITAPDGKEQTGYDPTSGLTYNSIPNSTYSNETLRDDVTGEDDAEPVKFLDVYGPATGTYTIKVIGTDTGTYAMKIATLDTSGVDAASTELDDIPTFAGDIQQYTVDYQNSATAPLTFEAGYAGGGQSKQANAFLEYSSPAAARVKVSANVTSYRIDIQYGSTIVPATFSATLNGNDVSSLFHPQPGTIESVTIPLQAGSNKLLFKVQGVETNGHTATDRDSFTIISS